MGYYINPHNEVTKFSHVGAFTGVWVPPPAGYVWAAHLQRPMFAQSVILFDASEWEEFQYQVRVGIIDELGLYAVPLLDATRLTGYKPR